MSYIDQFAAAPRLCNLSKLRQAERTFVLKRLLRRGHTIPVFNVRSTITRIMPPKQTRKMSADAEESDDSRIVMQMMSLLNDDTILKKLRDALYPRELANKNDLTNAKLTKLSAQLAERDEHIAELDKKVSTLEFELDELQQYTRRPNLRIQGIEEDFRGEDLERKVLAVINSHMKVDPPVERKDIERCHRLGRVDAQKNQPRTSIVRFAFM